MANTPYYTKAEADSKNQEIFRGIKQTTESISAGEGGKSYTTLAEAQAVDPKPIDGTVFQVEQTDSSNAGYHKFNSTKAGGTQFLRAFQTYSKGVFDSTSTISSSHPDVFKAIKKVEIYNSDPTKRYFLKFFGRNRDDGGGEHEGKYYFIIEEEGANSQYGVAIWNDVLTENPNGITEVELLTDGVAGISGKAWVNWSDLNDLQYNPYLHFTDSEINVGLLSNSIHALETEKKLDQLIYEIHPEFEFGGIGSDNGILVSNNVRVRTKEIEVSPGSYKIESVVPQDIVVSNYIFYDNNGTFVAGYTTDPPTPLAIPDGVGILRISYKKIDGSVITQAQLDSFQMVMTSIDDIGYSKIQEDVKTLKKDVKTISSGGKWLGKKLSVLGDSISYGFIPRNYPGYPGQLNSYAKLTADKLGMSFQNNGISGSTLGALSLGTTTRAPFVYRYQDLDDNSDLVLVKGGTNDIRNGIPLGTMSDTEETTYYGALHKLCLGLLDKYRHAQGVEIGKNKHVVLITPIKVLGTDIKPFAEAVKEVAAYYSLPVWDAYNLSGINPHILRTVQGYEDGYLDMYNPYITDGTHPTQEGHEIMSQSLIGFLNTI